MNYAADPAPVSSPELTGPNPVSMLVGVLYDVLSGITGIVGLTPLQFVGVFAGVFLLYLGYTFVRANFGDKGWSVDDDEPNPYFERRD